MWTMNYEDAQLAENLKEVMNEKPSMVLKDILTTALELPSWATKEVIAEKLVDLL